MIRISEIFGPTIQGEGALIGQPTVFVRTGGCDFRCSWCDSLHAVDSRFRDDWRPMHATEIWAEVTRLSGGVPLTVSLSGGNPAIQPLGDLIALGQAQGYRFAMETQGSVARDWFAALDLIVLSPKPPSSGMDSRAGDLAACLAAAGAARAVLKFVIFDEADYLWSRAMAASFPGLAVYLQPGNPLPPPGDGPEPDPDTPDLLARMRWLIDRVAADRWFSAHVLPQLHVLLWGNRRGV
ncbi:7-carboxy-7-deazaguanine synthase QueE [Plastorhodobacter daqingensis]|uniref:7-carboxy-7-deazaguanine synthase n=1 Tax=Plastorhodobacter daqingensis TaxID=1387281 RepID=A0ABW2UNC1_9RHOB